MYSSYIYIKFTIKYNEIKWIEWNWRYLNHRKIELREIKDN